MPDHRSRTLAMFLAFLDEPSGSVHGAPVLSNLDIDDIKKSPTAQVNLIKVSEWFFQFLIQNQR